MKYLSEIKFNKKIKQQSKTSGYMIEQLEKGK